MDDTLKFVDISYKFSASCPDLTLYRDEEDDEDLRASAHHRYKRTLSECPGIMAAASDAKNRTSSIISINRTQSDTDLRKIDRKRTFAGINTVEPNDLLAKVANALGQLRPEEDEEDMRGGVHGFSDQEILASERTWGGWSNVANGNNGHQQQKCHQRLRATSETKLPAQGLSNDDAYEWTWSGANNQIADLRKLRTQNSRYNDLYRASFSNAAVAANRSRSRRQSEEFSGSGGGVTVIAMPPSPETTITGNSQNKFMGRFNNMFRKRAMSTSSSGSMMQQLPSNMHEDAIKYLKATSNEYPSNQRHLNANTYNGGGGGGMLGPGPGASRRGSIYESLQSENSQILENTTIADLIKVLEAVHTQANLPDGVLPKRKMGTASLTPPRQLPPSILGIFDPTPDPRSYETYNPSMSRRGSMFPSLGGGSSRRSSLMPSTSNKAQPPPYSALEVPQPVSQAKRRFSVRPSQLTSSVNSLSSNSSVQQVPPVTRKMSLKPSPLARDPATSSFRDSGSGRFVKPISLQREVTSHNARQRQGSLSHNLPERTFEKKRYDSK